MKNIKNTEMIVKDILKKDPETRSSDMLLYYRVCETLNSEVLLSNFGYMLLSLKEYGLPSFKTVERARRKLQSIYPELASSKKITEKRKKRELFFRRYAKEHKRSMKNSGTVNVKKYE